MNILFSLRHAPTYHALNIFSRFFSRIEDTLAKNYYIITMRISNYAT